MIFLGEKPHYVTIFKKQKGGKRKALAFE